MNALNREMTPEQAAAWEGLSHREQAFIAEYLMDFNATRAWLRMIPTATYGTAKISAHKMLQKKKVQNVLSLLCARIVFDHVADLEEVLTEITNVIRNENEDINTRLRAMDMRLKTLGAYLDKQEIKQETTLTINIEGDED